MGKIYVVTGGTDGIGKSLVNKILESTDSNDKVIVNYGHNDKKAQTLLDDITEEKKNRVVLLKADLSNYDKMLSFCNNIKSQFNNIDYLICNVGVAEYEKFDDYTLDRWNEIINTNLTMPTFLIKEMKDNINKFGSILLVGSYAGKKGFSSSVVYSISKAGLLFLAEVLVKELESNAIRINAIAPGFTETAWHNERKEESRERINQKIALHRFGNPEEIADMAYSILINGYMNGSVVDIHGGYEYF